MLHGTGIFTYIWLKFMMHVGKSSSFMEQHRLVCTSRDLFPTPILKNPNFIMATLRSPAESQTFYWVTCKIPRSTQRGVLGIRRSPKMCQENHPIFRPEPGYYRSSGASHIPREIFGSRLLIRGKSCQGLTCLHIHTSVAWENPPILGRMDPPRTDGYVVNNHTLRIIGHWTLQWKGLNLYSRDRVLKMASFEGSGSLG